jgi:photosystem II stability/assembly factor-like uncharacterized protein
MAAKLSLAILLVIANAGVKPVFGQPTVAGAGAGADDITWLVDFDGKRLPPEQGWRAFGEAAAKAGVVGGSLRIVDASPTEMGFFRAAWTPDFSREVIVEAKVRVESAVLNARAPDGRRLRVGFFDGAPIGVLVSDGRHQEGLLLEPGQIGSFLDRRYLMNTRADFHTYRLVIHENDMRIYVDGALKIQGDGAFWKPADSPEAFVQFGSSSPQLMGDSLWSSVRLGIRKVPAAPKKRNLRITVGNSWEIPPAVPGARQTRPSVYNMGRGLLLMNICQGPDAVYEPFGVMKSTDAGRTWQPVPELQVKLFAPQAMLRLSNGEILGVSRWSVKYDHVNHTWVGMSYRFDPKAERFTMFENTIHLPEGISRSVCFDRDLFDLGNGEILASVYSNVGLDSRLWSGPWRAYLVNSTDGGATWKHFSTVADNPEPAYARLSTTEMTAILRTAPRQPLVQRFSHDGGKSWSAPAVLDVGSVAPNLCHMGNGVLACSYGRLGSNLMFSTDGGKTWGDNRVISGGHGFNWSSVCEVSPGRLLYVHDDGQVRAVYVDVERIQ